MEFRKIIHRERLAIEDAVKPFGALDLQGGSKEEENRRIRYNLCFNFTHLNPNSGEVKKVGAVLKKRLGADEIWLVGSRIA